MTPGSLLASADRAGAEQFLVVTLSVRSASAQTHFARNPYLHDRRVALYAPLLEKMA